METTATTAAPGPLDALDKQRPGEPRFVLLGRDPDAPAGIAGWCDARRKRLDLGQYTNKDGGNPAPADVRDELVQITEAEDVAADMVRYRRQHPEADTTTPKRASYADTAPASAAISERERIMAAVRHLREAAYHIGMALEGLGTDPTAGDLWRAQADVNAVADAVTPGKGGAA